MKQLTLIELRQQELSALKKIADETRDEIDQARLEIVAGKRANINIKLIKDYLARVLTIIRELELLTKQEEKKA